MEELASLVKPFLDKDGALALTGPLGFAREASSFGGKKMNDQAPASAVEQVRVRVLPDGRMTQDHAALYVGVASKTLANLASQGKGPRRVKVQGRVFYYREDLDRFIRGTAGDLVA